jgi:hypothetical protein
VTPEDLARLMGRPVHVPPVVRLVTEACTVANRAVLLASHVMLPRPEVGVSMLEDAERLLIEAAGHLATARMALSLDATAAVTPAPAVEG